jgi:hypothetical protein
MRSFWPVLAALALLTGCQSADDAPAPDPPSAAAVVDSAVAAHGGTVLDRAVVQFRFRGDRYRIRQADGRFHFRRTYTDSLERTVHDGLTNDGPYRVVDGDTVALSDAERRAVRTTVNSVSYFALLPHPLQDPAVQPSYSGRDTIDGVPYHRLRVTFQQEGGGQDWEDVFFYWFRTDSYAMDYLAYAYGLGSEETDPGTRFREAYNVRRVNGARFADYRNYTADTLRPTQMAQYPTLRAQDALELVSRIEVDSVQVRPLAP